MLGAPTLMARKLATFVTDLPATATVDPLIAQSQEQLEAAQAEAERWKTQSRKQESRAKSNASAAEDLEEADAQLADLSQRIAAIEGENEALKAKTWDEEQGARRGAEEGEAPQREGRLAARPTDTAEGSRACELSDGGELLLRPSRSHLRVLALLHALGADHNGIAELSRT